MYGSKNRRNSRSAIYILFIFSAMVSAAVFPFVTAQSTTGSVTIQKTICNLIGTISSIIGIFAIFLFVLGGILYGLAHILPAAGNLKGSTQGWGVGMMIGGVIAIVLYLLSSFIIYRLASFSNSTNSLLPAITQVNCNTDPDPYISAVSIPVTTSIPLVTTTSSKSSGNTGQPGFACGSGSETVPIADGNFSSGSYAGWNVTGSGFGPGPTDINIANNNNYYYRRPWSNYYSEFFATTFRQNSTLPAGNLTYSNIYVDEPYLNFKIVSPQSRLLYVELLVGGAPFMKVYYNTTNGQGSYPLGTFANASISLLPVACQDIGIRIVAEGPTSQNNFIAVGDFYLSSNPVETPGIVVNSTVI